MTTACCTTLSSNEAMPNGLAFHRPWVCRPAVMVSPGSSPAVDFPVQCMHPCAESFLVVLPRHCVHACRCIGVAHSSPVRVMMAAVAKRNSCPSSLLYVPPSSPIDDLVRPSGVRGAGFRGRFLGCIPSLHHLQVIPLFDGFFGTTNVSDFIGVGDGYGFWPAWPD
jgi:hypothetical protein